MHHHRSPGAAARAAAAVVLLALALSLGAAPALGATAGPDLVYRPEDLAFPLAGAARVIGDADVEAVLARLLGKNAFLIPLLQLDRGDRRGKIRRLLQLEAAVRSVDLKDLGKFENALRLDAFRDLWQSIQGVRGKAATGAELASLERAVETYGMLVDLAKRLGSTTKRGRYAWLLAMARDELSRRVKDQEKVRVLKQLIREDLLEALAHLGSRPERDAPATKADIEEKLKTLDQEFGGLNPLHAPTGQGITTTSAMGLRRHPKTGRIRPHEGIDLASAGCDGWKVVAVGPGRVVRSDWNGGYGFMVVVRHDLDAGVFYSRYGHLRNEGRAAPGTVVGRGDPIGLCNNTGVSTGPHLHFEVRRGSENGKPIDPHPLLTGSAAALPVE
ncbi:MAG: M23 family metallopeptidase [Candidatus Riflebacteria bacterium]|nr:M23 family metallopeptidase [Candidatus Riflebacteria bacterium]